MQLLFSKKYSTPYIAFCIKSSLNWIRWLSIACTSISSWCFSLIFADCRKYSARTRY
ncbi:unknown [Salmonella phage FelixO1]|uniref:Uncharacterized protein n=1 Tax=Salmonella phage Felix O1 (isolate Felix O1-VT1) TaxID=1283336 RepID=Q6KGE0_BPFO1|nr:unknown [Salmonella phage FelixO1]